jgi:conjugal transfer/type IV secretion protein DotA/TraY
MYYIRMINMMRKLAKISFGVLAPLLLAAPVLVLAQDGRSITADSLIAAANRAGDLSIGLLKSIFGDGFVTNPFGTTGGSPATFTYAGHDVLPGVFAIFNGAVLAIGSVWCAYTLMAGTAETAHHGEFMGKKYSGPMVPIRLTAGFVGLIPFFGGWSLAQALMVWGTLSGIGLANIITDAGADILGAGGSLVAPPAAMQPATTVVNGLFNSYICMDGVNLSIDEANKQLVTPVDASERILRHASFAGGKLLMEYGAYAAGGSTTGGDALNGVVPEHSCGGVELSLSAANDNALAGIAEAHKQALASVEVTAKHEADSLLTTGSFRQTALDEAAKQYSDFVVQAAHTSDVAGIPSQVLQNMKAQGWLGLGSWFMTYAKVNERIAEAANAKATGLSPNPPSDFGFNQYYQAALLRGNAIVQNSKQNDVSDVGGVLDKLFSPLSKAWSFLGNSVDEHSGGQAATIGTINLATGGLGGGSLVNPLVAMKNLGDYIITTAEVAIGIVVIFGGKLTSLIGGVVTGASAGTAAAGPAGTIAGAVGGLAVGAFAQQIIATIGWMLLLALLGLIFFAGVLSVYLPMVPFIEWFGGILSWLGVVIESLLAAPLWALVHLDAEGEGMGERSTHGYIFWLNVLFRPALMVIAFLVASASVIALGTLLNQLYPAALANAQMGSLTGVVTFFGQLAIYVTLRLTLTHVMFSLIHVIPDQVINWVGGHVSGQLGRDIHEKTKQAIVGGVARAENAAASRVSRGKPDSCAGDNQPDGEKGGK